MEQHQFRVSRSVGTKLLASGVLLLAIVVGFLNFSAIYLLKEDKKAYIYQSQATEAVLTGREFANQARRVIDSLRLALASVDPLKPVGPRENDLLRSVAENQSDAAIIRMDWVDPKTGAPTNLARVAGRENTARAERAERAIGDLQKELTSGLQEILPDLNIKGFGFLNLSVVGDRPLLGVVVADTKLVGNAKGIPVAIGIVPLEDFIRQLNGLNLTIATRAGRVLFDTDPAVLFSSKGVGDDPLFEAALNSQLSNGAQEYERDGVRYLGSYVSAGLDLVVTDRMEWSKAMKAAYTLSEKFLLLGIMAIAIAVVFTILFSKTLIRPINRLYEATKEVAKGNFALDIKPESSDEIGALSASFVAMSNQISELIRIKMDKMRMESEMAIASTVQQTLIPPASFSEDGVRIFSHYQSANECGGDWWGFFGVGNKMVLMIADATGHGLPSALITASARSCMSVLHKLAQEDRNFSFAPSSMLRYANRVIFDASLARINMTFFAATIDFEKMTLSYSNAGHNPPWLFRKSEQGYSQLSLAARGPRLGEVADCSEFEDFSVAISPGDLLFMYTDGVIEGKNTSGAMFGKKRLRNLVQESLPNGPEFVIQSIRDQFSAHNSGKDLDDDVTLAAVLITGSRAGQSNPPTIGEHAKT